MRRASRLLAAGVMIYIAAVGPLRRRLEMGFLPLWNRRKLWDSRRTGRTLILVALASPLVLSACSGSGSALRGVGAKQDIALVNEPDTGLDPDLLEGVVMNNVATEPTTEVTAYAPDVIPPEPEMAADREGAVRQIRQKAASLPDEKPNVFDRGNSSVTRMSVREQEELRAELAAIAARNRSAIDPNEAEYKAAQMRRLREQARSHYRDTLNKIED